MDHAHTPRVPTPVDIHRTGSEEMGTFPTSRGLSVCAHIRGELLHWLAVLCSRAYFEVSGLANCVQPLFHDNVTR